MKALTIRYLNEIVGLTVMALMTVALIAGEADATIHRAAQSDAAYGASRLAASLEAVMESTTIRADLEIRLDLQQLIDAASETESREAIRDLIRIRLDRD